MAQPPVQPHCETGPPMGGVEVQVGVAGLESMTSNILVIVFMGVSTFRGSGSGSAGFGGPRTEISGDLPLGCGAAHAYSHTAREVPVSCHCLAVTNYAKKWPNAEQIG